jgi:hypothetical protein
MLPGTFARNLRKLNPRLRIFCGNDDSKPASIYYVKNGEEQTVCGIDKNYVPEWIIWNEDGSIAKGGWRRALKILLQKKLIDRKKAERLFRADLSYKQPKFIPQAKVNMDRSLASRGHFITERG